MNKYEIRMTTGYNNSYFKFSSRMDALGFLETLHDSFDREASDSNAKFTLKIVNEEKEDNDGNDTV